jgi:hypothetical protein
MGKRIILGLGSMVIAGLTLTGCQSSDSGSGGRLLSRQPDSSFSKPMMTSNTSGSMQGGKSLAISDTNSRPGMMQTSTGVQQTSAMQNASLASGGPSPASASTANLNQTGAVPGFDQGGQEVSRPMANPVNSTSTSGPVPPSPPGDYKIPAPTTFTPPADPPVVPTRKPGDDL